ncbi:MAG: SDR family oxidoreductase [Bacteroidota bacterium]
MKKFDVSNKSLADLISLKDRVAVVTGGARGIGFAIANRLAEAGAQVIIGDLNINEAIGAANRLNEKFEVQASARMLNVADELSIYAFIQDVLQQNQKIDIWVNNAGIYPFIGALDITDSAYDTLVNINQRGTFICTREAAKSMVERDINGIIVNVVSTAAIKTAGNSTHYVTSKHAVAGLTQGFARELGVKGVRVLAVAPTLVETPGVEILKKSNAELEKGLDGFAASLPLGRAALPDDVARVVLFCASDLAMFMTGSIVFVDGGEITF